MTHVFRACVLVSALVAGTACGARQVEVRTTVVPDTTLPVIVVTNALTQAVNVYVTVGTTDMFVRQVAPSSTQRCPVQSVKAGSTVGVKAVTVDLQRSFSRAGIVLVGSVPFTIP
jgi:hypothetical protein